MLYHQVNDFMKDKLPYIMKRSYSMISSENNKERKILEIMKDSKLNFRSCVNELRKKPFYKVAALSKLSSYLYNSEKKNSA